MRKIYYLCIVKLIFIICVDCAFSEKYVVIEKHKTGVIDWTNRTITSKGHANHDITKEVLSDNEKNMLYNKAKVSASKNLFISMGKIQINSKSNLEYYISSKQELLKQIQLMINNAQIIKKEYLKTGAAEITLQTKIDRGLAQLVLPEEIIQIEPIKTFTEPPSKLQKDIFTGIIIDARGLKIHPVMSPRILDENSNEVYGPAFISREYAVQHGTAQYVSEIISNDRIGKKPIIVTGLKTLPNNNADIVISTADASKLHSSSQNLDLLHQGKVLIVIDSQ